MRRCKILKNPEAISGVALVFKNQRAYWEGQCQGQYALGVAKPEVDWEERKLPNCTIPEFWYLEGKIPFHYALGFLKLEVYWLGVILGCFWSKIEKTAKPDETIFFHLFATGWNHLSCDVLKRPEIPRVCFNVLMHRIKDRTSPTELNVFTELVLPLLELLSPATTVHLEPSDLAHALSALQMAYDLSGGTSIKE